MATPQGGNTTYNISHKSGKPDDPPADDENITEDDDPQGDQNEEDTEETDDTETDSGKDEDSDTTDDSEDEEEEDVTQLLDLKKVPPQFREVAKKMIATQNKWIANVKKQLEQKEGELQTQYAREVVKSAGWDKLVKLPEFEKFWEDISNGRPYGYSVSRSNGKNGNDEDEDSSASENKPVSVEALTKAITPVIKKMLDDRLAPLREKEANDAWADAEKNLKNFGKYKAAVTAKLTRYPNMSIEEAYEIVSSKDRENEAISKALKSDKEVGKKIPRQTLKPGSATGGKRDFDKKTIDSIDKALNLARVDLAAK